MSDFIATFVMSVGLLFYMFGSTKISEFSDIRKCLNTFMYQTLVFLASKNAAEIRIFFSLIILKILEITLLEMCSLQSLVVYFKGLAKIPLLSDNK